MDGKGPFRWVKSPIDLEGDALSGKHAWQKGDSLDVQVRTQGGMREGGSAQ